MKRYDGRTKPVPRKAKSADLHPGAENMCLLRASLGKRKLSTVVHQKDMNRFNQAYSNVLKANIDGLKKRDKRTVGGDQSSKSTPTPTVSAATVGKSPKTPLIGHKLP